MDTQIGNELPVNTDAQDPRDGLRALIAARPWKEGAELVIADILAVTEACTRRQLTIIEVKQFCAAFCIATATLLELMDGPQNDELMGLMTAMQSLAEALQRRAHDDSVQSRYAEARVSSRKALGENHDPILDQFPKLKDLARMVCSHEVAGYMSEEVQLGCEQFLDMLQMLAADHADPATVANPPARIRRALARTMQRNT